MHALEKRMATHCNILVWRMPWTGEPGRLWVTVHGVSKSQTQLSYQQHLMLAVSFLHQLDKGHIELREFLFLICQEFTFLKSWICIELWLSVPHCYCLIVKSCPILCDSMNCSPPGSSVHEISQARTLERVAISIFRGSSWPRDQTCVSCIDRQILYHGATREAPIYPYIHVLDRLHICIYIWNYIYIIFCIHCDNQRTFFLYSFNMINYIAWFSMFIQSCVHWIKLFQSWFFLQFDEFYF